MKIGIEDGVLDPVASAWLIFHQIGRAAAPLHACICRRNTHGKLSCNHCCQTATIYLDL
jgi:hypothetical protein